MRFEIPRPHRLSDIGAATLRQASGLGATEHLSAPGRAVAFLGQALRQDFSQQITQVAHLDRDDFHARAHGSPAGSFASSRSTSAGSMRKRPR